MNKYLLIDFQKDLSSISDKQREEDEKYFKSNPPIKEIEIIHHVDINLENPEKSVYGFWIFDNQIGVAPKMANGYHKRHIQYYDKEFIKVLASLL